MHNLPLLVASHTNHVSHLSASPITLLLTPHSTVLPFSATPVPTASPNSLTSFPWSPLTLSFNRPPTHQLQALTPHSHLFSPALANSSPLSTKPHLMVPESYNITSPATPLCGSSTTSATQTLTKRERCALSLEDELQPNTS